MDHFVSVLLDKWFVFSSPGQRKHICNNILKNLFGERFCLRGLRLDREQVNTFHKNSSSRSQMFFKIGVLEIFANFTVKHLCWSLFYIKPSSMRKSVRIRSFSGPYFPAFGLNIRTKKYGKTDQKNSECGHLLRRASQRKIFSQQLQNYWIWISILQLTYRCMIIMVD